jgi:ring-1,2-phenylacetyl-CoA epoxidase subunit PaaD
VISEKEVWQALEPVVDPEIPTVTLIEMGIIRRVSVERKQVTIAITPTFAGCPALHVMQKDIRRAVADLTDIPVDIQIELSPPWTSDSISRSGREKLRKFGLAPPRSHGGDIHAALLEAVACPYCSSENTSIKNSWGPTPCRMIFYCNACSQPFERFKPL